MRRLVSGSASTPALRQGDTKHHHTGDRETYFKEENKTKGLRKIKLYQIIFQRLFRATHQLGPASRASNCMPRPPQTTLHCTTLHYTTLHLTTLHCSKVLRTALHHSARHAAVSRCAHRGGTKVHSAPCSAVQCSARHSAECSALLGTAQCSGGPRAPGRPARPAFLPALLTPAGTQGPRGKTADNHPKVPTFYYRLV